MKKIKSILKAVGIEKAYGTKNKFLAIDNIDLEIFEGDFIGIMGPSGSGKTTLLNMMSTIDEPTKGKIIINEKNIFQMGELEISRFRYENIGFVFQDFNLLDTMTIGENISIPLTLSNKLNSKEIRGKVIEAAKSVGIEDTIDKFPSECSGGQRQRAAIARALINKPSIIIADEPTGNLDSKNSHEIVEMLKTLNEENKITILMVTHDATIASYTKRLLFIKDGKIEGSIEKGYMSQNEFFHEIVDITSKDSQELFK